MSEPNIQIERLDDGNLKIIGLTQEPVMCRPSNLLALVRFCNRIIGKMCHEAAVNYVAQQQEIEDEWNKPTMVW